jgi:hypothetical protein
MLNVKGPGGWRLRFRPLCHGVKVIRYGVCFGVHVNISSKKNLDTFDTTRKNNNKFHHVALYSTFVSD